jgi:xylan 1,4-beta-xylosidase
MRKSISCGVVVALCLGIAWAALVQGVAVKLIDHQQNSNSALTDYLGNITGNFMACVGSGHALLTLREDYRNQLRVLQKEIGFGSIRFHAILDDDMSTYLNGVANMFNVFSTLDLLQSDAIRMDPIIELSFMPELLALNSSNTVFHYQGGTSQPANWTAWGVFIEQFVQLCLDRYGLAALQRWRFEIWNEVCFFPLLFFGSLLFWFWLFFSRCFFSLRC